MHAARAGCTIPAEFPGTAQTTHCGEAMRLSTPDDAVADVPDGAIILIGGVAGGGQPFERVRPLERHGAHNLTVVTNNASVHDNTELLVDAGLVRKVIASFPVPASTARVTAVERLYRAGDLEVETVPQG